MLKAARRIALAAGLAAAALACLGGRARALDLVRLRNGGSLEGTVAKETRKYIMLEVEGGAIRIERADIFRIERGLALADWEKEMRERARREAAEFARKALARLQASATQEAAEEERELADRLKALVEEMASEDPETRSRARLAIESEGEKAVPALTEALSHGSTFVRTTAAVLLGGLGARASVRDMIVALRSAVPELAKVKPWQRAFVRALRDGLRGITGRNFGLRHRGARQRGAVDGWVKWWDGEASEDEPGAVPKGACADWDTPQLGEPELDEDDPEYARKLWEARRVGERSHSYSAPAEFGGGPREGER